MVFGNWLAALESKAALTTIDFRIMDVFGTYVKSATGAVEEAPAFIERLRDQLSDQLREMVELDYDQDWVTAVWRDETTSAGEVLTFDYDGQIAVTPVQPFDDETWEQFFLDEALAAR